MTAIQLNVRQPLCRIPKAAHKLILVLTGFCCGIGITSAAMAAKPADIDDAKIVANAKTGKEWPSNGLDYAATRFSRLKQIDSGNVKKLGLAWTYKLESTRGVQATPIVVGGVMYVTAPWSIVHAIDVRTGKRLWSFDPKPPRLGGWKACCGPGNRGVAVYQGKVYLASLDARLIALDAATGKKVWEQDTKSDQARKITMTAAPYVVKGKVIVGNAGSEYGVRPYVSAYDAETGTLKWRWFVVPGDPSQPYEDESQAAAAKTWDPTVKYWEIGGGGTVWNTMAFDLDLNLVYFGTGNPTPWSKTKRSPAGGDNLYTVSVVALNLDTGKYVWHYQENPADDSDYDACEDLILTDIKIDDKLRKVILHAPKNGFFYVIDRTNGQFISAKNFVEQNWALGFESNGRPIPNPAVSDKQKPVEVMPGAGGGHNWQSMSYSPATGLAYIPANHVPGVFADDDNWTGRDSYKAGGAMQFMSGMGWNVAQQLDNPPPQGKRSGRLIAWDPVRQKEAWSKDLRFPFNGGTLATAGNLVFQGAADGHFRAFNARDGQVLWQTPVGSGVIAAPVTYELGGKQYVSIAVGWGGAYGDTIRHTEFKTGGTVYTFVLGGKAKMPPFEKYDPAPLLSGVTYDPKDVPAGAALYVSHCATCHGSPATDNGGAVRNLAYVDKHFIENLDKVLFGGPFGPEGMPDYTGKLTVEHIEQLKAFIQGSADAIRPKQQ